MLVWHHSEEDGALGVVINRALTHRLPEVLDLEDDVDLTAYDDTQVVWGGPMETGSGTVITKAGLEDEDEGWILPNGLGVTRSHYALVRLLEAQAPVMLCLGYAGWAPGQLDREIEEGGWLFTDCDAAIMFETAPEDRYDRALASLGLTSSMVWMQPVDE
ncbi:MAG: YqgE/AlgH family protein [Myxococcales bacterium]|nr:YqgE/AlgH family protein [Myxococcales bacterium]